MRTNKKKRRQTMAAYLLFAVVGVQIAIYLVWKNSGSDSEEYVAEAGPADAAPVDNSFHPDLFDPNAQPETTDTQASQPIAGDSRPQNQPSSDTKGRHQRRKSDHHSRPKKEVEQDGPAKRIGHLSIMSDPEGAKIYIDGIFAGNSPLLNVEAVEGQHKIVFEHKDAERKTVSVTIRADGNRKISEALQLHHVAAIPIAPPERSPPTPKVGLRAKGSADRGKSILSSGCNPCHRKAGAPRVGPRMRTASQWIRFFSRGSHDRFQRIGQDVNYSQVAHVKSYLISKAADTDKNQGAGIRE